MKKYIAAILLFIFAQLAYGQLLLDIDVKESKNVGPRKVVSIPPFPKAEGSTARLFLSEYQRLKSVSEEELTDSIIRLWSRDTIPNNPKLLASLFIYLWRDDLTEDISEGVSAFVYEWLALTSSGNRFISDFLSIVPANERKKIKQRMLYCIMWEMNNDNEDVDLGCKDSLQVYYNRVIQKAPHCKSLLPINLLDGIVNCWR